MNEIAPYGAHRFSVQSGLNWDCKHCGAMLGGGRDRGRCRGPFICHPGAVKNSCEEKTTRTLGASCVPPSLLRPVVRARVPEGPYQVWKPESFA